HFPASACSPYGIEAVTPDEFLLDLWSLDSREMLRILHKQAADLRNPPQTLDDVLTTLGQTVPQFIAQVRRQL
ncbi:MAG: PIN domain-containing protein, partial [Chloroflexi bacterium]|nr:PIN domain-containing protein [Chloroflexota bacterium]